MITLPGDQFESQTIADGFGGTFLVWEDNRNGSDTDIYALRIAPNGLVHGDWPADGLVVCDAPGDQTNPSVSYDPLGNLWVAWEDARSGTQRDIYVQGIRHYGVPFWLANGHPLCIAPGDQVEPRVAHDGSLGVFVAWEDRRNNPNGFVAAMRLLEDSAVAPGWSPNGTAITVDNVPVENPCLAPGAGGTASIAWEFGFPGSPVRLKIGTLGPSGPGIINTLCDPACFNGFDHVRDPRLFSDGQGGVFLLYRYTGNFHNHLLLSYANFPPITVTRDLAELSSVALVADANTITVAWEDWRNYPDHDVYVQRFDRATGARSVSWPANGSPACVASGDQVDPALCLDADLGAFVTWEDRRSGRAIRSQRLLATGRVANGWPADGLIVASSTGDQQRATVVPSAPGVSIIVWQDARGTDEDIYATQVVAQNIALPGWIPEGAGICGAPYDQSAPVMLADGSHGAFFVWVDRRSGNADIYAHKVTASGLPAAGWPFEGAPVCTAAGDQIDPVIVADGTGGALIAWRDFRDGPTADVYVQSIDAAGVRRWFFQGLPACTAAGDQADLRMVADGTGGALLCWRDLRSSLNEAFAQHLTSTGAIATGWVANGRALCPAVGDQFPSAALADGAGGMFVAWSETRGASNADIYVTRCAGDGTTSPGWPSAGLAVCSNPGIALNPVLASDGDSGVLVAWLDWRTSSFDLYANRVFATGGVDPAWPVDGTALCTAAGHQTRVRIEPDGDGGLYATWQDARVVAPTVFAQRIESTGQRALGWNADGNPLAADFALQSAPSIIGTGSGVLVVWEDGRAGGSTPDVYVQALAPDGTATWTANGIAICTAVGAQRAPAIASDGWGGAILCWEDARAGDKDVYVQRVSAGGRIATDVGELGEDSLLRVLGPNPFRDTVRFVAQVPQRSPYSLTVFDAAGRRVLEQASRWLPSGRQLLEWDGRDARGREQPAGIYFVQLRGAGIESTRKIVRIR